MPWGIESEDEEVGMRNAIRLARLDEVDIWPRFASQVYTSD
ncbi:hypothetical protein AB1I63_00825 [Streptococcus pneumoniae]